MADPLLDTGPFVALIDRSEPNHERRAAFSREFRGRLITTESVLTEAVHLLGPSLSRQKPALLKRCAHLMSEYSDVPMDYADATLVAMGDTLGIRIFPDQQHDGAIGKPPAVGGRHPLSHPE